MNVLITGASRGIGLELCRLGLGKGHNISAVARDPMAAKDLQSLQGKFGSQLKCIAQDVADPNAAQKIKAALPWSALDVLINNAGVYEKLLSEESLSKSFQVNSTAPLLLTQELLELLRKSRQPKVIQITSKMGSIADNTSGGSYAYRASKAALNMLNKSLAIDNPWLTALVVHPGWVRTEMGGAQAPTAPADSARGIWRLIEEAQSRQSGTFLDFQGQSIPW